MSFEITTAFVKQYGDNIEVMSQQKGSKLRSSVGLKTGIRGKEYFHDQVAATAARKRTNRHADTPLISTPHRRRKLFLYDFDWADLIDDLDKVKMLADPTSPYAINAAYAMGRSMDDEIIACANATAYTGVDGATSTPFDTTNNQILHGSVGMSVAKLLLTKRKLDVSEDTETKRHILVSAAEVADLLNEAEVKSADYNTVKALAMGQINTFIGFDFHQTERLSYSSSTGIRLCLAWIEDGILLGIGVDIEAVISRRADKNNAYQPYYKMSIGATRTDERKVVEIGTYHA
jgi:hypothetical protein